MNLLSQAKLISRPSAEQAVIALISLPMFGSAVWSVGDQMLPALLRITQGRGFSPAVLALCLSLVLAGIWVQLLYFAGPIAASAAGLQWLPTADLLAHDQMLTWLATAAVIAVLVTLVALAARAMGWPVPQVAVSSAVVLTGSLLLTLWLQRRDAPALVELLSAAFLIAALTLAAVQAWSTPAGLALGSAATLVCALRNQTPRNRRPLTGQPHPLVPRWQMVRGHTNRWSLNAGILTLDGDIVEAVRESQGQATRQALPARWYRTPKPLPVVVFWRSLSSAFLPAAALLLTALIAERLLGTGAGLAVFVVLQYQLTIATGRSAESWLTSPALQRIWGRRSTPVELFMPVLVTALLVTGVVALTVSPPLPALLVLLAVPALVLWRRELARRSEGLTLLSTPAGPLPIQTVNRAIAGYDVLAVGVLIAWGL